MSKIDAFNVILERLRPFLDDETIAAFAELHRHPGSPPGAGQAAAGRLRDLASRFPKTGSVFELGLRDSHNLAVDILAATASVVFKMFMMAPDELRDAAPVDDQHIAWEADSDASAAASLNADRAPSSDGCA